MDFDNMTDAEIQEFEVALKKRKKQAAIVAEKKKKEYVKQRDKLILDLVPLAKTLSEKLFELKAEAHLQMNAQEERLNEYGEIRGNSKGGFSIDSSDKTMRITRIRQTQPNWDERSEKAVELIKDFLHDTVKKRDSDTFNILITFIEKNKNGDLEFSRVMELLAHRNKFDDARWLQGLNLIEESYSVHFKAFSYEFKVKDAHGKWQTLNLSFSSI